MTFAQMAEDDETHEDQQKLTTEEMNKIYK